jgi:dihydroflavonol-4-reductase
MNIMIVGGTGFLGYHALLVALRRGHTASALAIDDVEMGDWYPKDVKVQYGDVFELTEEDLQRRFAGFDAMIYAVGPDDRITPPAPSYAFFHTRLVDAVEKVAVAARKAGVKRFVVMNSYFAYFDRLWPEKQLAKHHPYIRCRVEQAERVIAAGQDKMAVMVLELPYIFGSMPKRTPLWKDVFLEKYTKGKVIVFPKGGTTMITVEHVGEAIIGALEKGEHGKRYPVGDENHTYNEMLDMMMNALGTPKKIINPPRFILELAGAMLEKGFKKKGLEGGLELRYLMRDILSGYLYFDPSETAAQLGYGRGGIEEAIVRTIKACYPEKFTKQDS